MKKTKVAVVIGFAIFASFFGAGNLILPPYLGFQAGPDWWQVAFGFALSATIIPMAALLAHAKLQGTMLDFGNKVSPLFSLIFCLCVYAIAISLPAPRTASVAHEMAIDPFFGTSSLLTSSIYFILVFVFVLWRGKILEIIGKYLTPLILIILVLIIGIGISGNALEMNPSTLSSPIVAGLLEGYQTYDALGGLLMGGVVIVSLNLEGGISFQDKKWLIGSAAIIAAIGLLAIYIGLILVGARSNASFAEGIIRTDLLRGLSMLTLGDFGSRALSVLISLACFTTAVAIITGTADFFKGLFKNNHNAYLITAFISCIIGVAMGQLDVHSIIVVALPVLMFIYPLSIVLILLNLIPENYASKLVFRIVVAITFIFSIPDFLSFLTSNSSIQAIQKIIPLGEQNLGWLLPALVALILVNLIEKTGSKKE